MNDLSTYHSHQNIIADLKEELAVATRKVLRVSQSKAEESQSKLAARERDIKIAWLLGAGESVKKIAFELKVSAQAVHRVNKLRGK